MASDRDQLDAALSTLVRRLLDRRAAPDHWDGRLASSALSTATAVLALHTAAQERYRRDRSVSTTWSGPVPPGCFSIRTLTAGGATPSAVEATSARRRSCGHRCRRLPGDDARCRAGNRPISRVAAARGGRHHARRAPFRHPPPIRQGPDVLGAHPDRARADGQARRRPPRGLAVDSTASVRAGRGAPRLVSASPAAGRELRAAGPDRDRPGAASLRAVAQSCRPRAERAGSWRDAPPVARHATRERRIPRSHAADQFRGHEPRGHGTDRKPGRGRGRAVPRRVDARRWKLADRHEPRDVGDDAVDRGAGGGRCAGARRYAVDAAMAARAAEHAGASVHPRGAGCVGVDPVERRRARRGRHVRAHSWRCGDLAIRIRRRLPPLPPAFVGCSAFRTGTEGSRRSAVGGERSRSIGALRRSPVTRCRRGASGIRTSMRRCSGTCAVAAARAVQFLAATQRPDGTWIPLWFGNEHAPDEDNPAYGTGRVLLGLHSPLVHGESRAAECRRLAVSWILEAQNADGGWGGSRGVTSSIEETGVVLAALGRSVADGDAPQISNAVARGARWLIDADAARRRRPRPWVCTLRGSGTTRTSTRSCLPLRGWPPRAAHRTKPHR